MKIGYTLTAVLWLSCGSGAHAGGSDAPARDDMLRIFERVAADPLACLSPAGGVEGFWIRPVGAPSIDTSRFGSWPQRGDAADDTFHCIAIGCEDGNPEADFIVDCSNGKPC